MGVCELHFKEEDINRPEVGRVSLHKCAVPHLCLPTENIYIEKKNISQNKNLNTNTNIVKEQIQNNLNLLNNDKNQSNIEENTGEIIPIGHFDKLLSAIKFFCLFLLLYIVTNLLKVVIFVMLVNL